MVRIHNSIQIASDTGVRRALSPLVALAERSQCYIQLVRHLNKTGRFCSMYRGGGSIGIVAACRTAFLFARDPHDPLCSVMAHFKSNLGPRQPGLGYRIVPHSSGAAVVDWLGPNALSADQLLVAAGIKPHLPRATESAREFLASFLEAGPRSTLDIWDAAAQLNIAKRTLQRIRREDNLRAKTVWVKDRSLTYWLLPGQKLPTDLEPPATTIPSLETYLAPIRQQFPSNPLEDDLDP